MKCKCIKSSSWYKIDDSLEQTENGGRFEYIINGEYEFEIIKNEHWGDSFEVFVDKNKTKSICWGSKIEHSGIGKTFLENFEII